MFQCKNAIIFFKWKKAQRILHDTEDVESDLKQSDHLKQSYNTSFDSPDKVLLFQIVFLSKNLILTSKTKTTVHIGAPSCMNSIVLRPMMLAKHNKRRAGQREVEWPTQENTRAHYWSPECFRGCCIDHVCSCKDTRNPRQMFPPFIHCSNCILSCVSWRVHQRGVEESSLPLCKHLFNCIQQLENYNQYILSNLLKHLAGKKFPSRKRQRYHKKTNHPHVCENKQSNRETYLFFAFLAQAHLYKIFLSGCPFLVHNVADVFPVCLMYLFRVSLQWVWMFSVLLWSCDCVLAELLPTSAGSRCVFMRSYNFLS